MGTRDAIGYGATGAGVGAAFGGPVGAGIGAGVGALAGAFGLFDDGSKEALLAKQRQLAAEAQRRREEVQRSHMRALNQTMLAAGPRNQVMAQMFGPEAAFSGKQMADMTANPMGGPETDQLWLQKQMAAGDFNLSRDDYKAKHGYKSGWDKDYGQLLEFSRKKQAYDQEEAARRAQMEAAFGTPQGPAPIAPTQVAEARKF